MTRQINAAAEAAKVAPPLSIASANFLGVAVSDWLLVLTLIYLVCQIVVISPKVYRTLMSRRDRAMNKTPEEVDP